MSEKRNRQQRWTVGPTLALMIGLVSALLGAGSSQAQTTTAKATPAASKAALVVHRKASEESTKGLGTGIKVYGRWTIEVKNRDGSLARHVEFENSLVTASNTPSATLTGSQLLVALLSGNASVGIGPGVSTWELQLLSLSNGDISPCTTGASNVEFGFVPSGTPFCNIEATVQPSIGSVIANSNVATGKASSSLPPTVVLSGTVQAQQNGTIDSVLSSFALQGIVIDAIRGNITETVGFPLTMATLPAANSGACGGTNQPSCAVPVSAGQSISATVVLSFQ